MSKLPGQYRSFKRITHTDLKRLAYLTLVDLRSLFERKSHSRAYADRLLLLCLCQGAATHYVRGDRGINDFDVWAFFKTHPKYVFPYRRRGMVDFGPSRFGCNSKDKASFTGRRIDVIGRAIAVKNKEKPIVALQRYLLEAPRVSSPWHLARQPVVVVWPVSLRGRVIWEGLPLSPG